MYDYVLVHFHAAGEEGCEDGRRVFPNSKRGRELAARFAIKRREDKQHRCGRGSVSIEYTNEELESVGNVYRFESTCGLDEEWEDA